MNVRNLKIIAGKLYREFGDFRPVDMSLSRTIKKRFLLNAPPAVTRRTASEFQTSVPRDLRFVFYEITSLYSRALHNGFFIIFFFFFLVELKILFPHYITRDCRIEIGKNDRRLIYIDLCG